MNDDKHGVSEVPVIQTIDEAWQLMETYERTGKWASMCISGWADLTIVNMIHQNLLGEIIHAEGGYVHDLRRVKFDPDEETWRLQHFIDRNGNLYPDHPFQNKYVDIDARISELRRQPYTARKFMIKHYDRVLFGTDTPPDAEAYRVYYRFLETDDEYFDPPPSHHHQGRWMIYGIHLPDEVLEKIYNKNAIKILAMKKK